MSARIDILPADERVHILSQRLKNLECGKGDFRPSNRIMAIRKCRRKLVEAIADLRRVN